MTKPKVRLKKKIGRSGVARKRAPSVKGFVERQNTRKLSGALKWLLPTLESAYTPLASKQKARPALRPMAISSLTGSRRGVLAAVAPDFWKTTLLQYKQRKASVLARPPAAAPGAPVIPGTRNWQPLGPSVVVNGQTVGNQPVAGRVVGLAIAQGGNLIYAASANGGVFCSRDGGTTWQSLMDRFDLQRTNFASASLVCGAIALDGADPNRVYVGTGEGETYQIFKNRITGALPAYRGVGPIRSDDGGTNWVPEASDPDLAGEAFFALALDPTNRENVVAGTTGGLYRREPSAGGQFQWSLVREHVHSSVAVARSGNQVRFFAAEWGQDQTSSDVLCSDDLGKTWTAAGDGFPSDDTGRVTLGVQPSNPDVVYALVANQSNGGLNGLYRLDAIGGTWKAVAGLPDVLPLQNGSSQGGYDLAIAVDPVDVSLVYLGGSYANMSPWPASIWRCTIVPSGDGYTASNPTSIGTHAHSDVHVLAHSPGDGTELWCGCDGGVFLNRDPKGTGEFVAQNNGLACLCSNFIGQHPTDPNIVFTGLQDNGTAVTTSGPIWTHVMGGDGGYCLVNWANPNLVLVYSNGTVLRSTTGGLSDQSWTQVTDFPWSTMTQPLVGPPYDPKNPRNANLVAMGAGTDVHISADFGSSWSSGFSIPARNPDNAVFALAFASPTRVFAGTTLGEVYQADLAGTKWTVKRLDDVAAGPIGVAGLINDIAVDWSDQMCRAVYVAFAGVGDARRVWRYDGSKWQDRSGSSAATHLLDVEHNAVTVDPATPSNVYVGADIGVWHSADSGLNWAPLENGLPEAPVFDLQIHPTKRLLRAALHGRGVYEMSLS